MNYCEFMTYLVNYHEFTRIASSSLIHDDTWHELMQYVVGRVNL